MTIGRWGSYGANILFLRTLTFRFSSHFAHAVIHFLLNEKDKKKTPNYFISELCKSEFQDLLYMELYTKCDIH